MVRQKRRPGGRRRGRIRPPASPRAAGVSATAGGGRVSRLGGWSWSRSRDVVLTLLGVAGLVYVAGGALRSVVGVIAATAVAALLAFLISPLVAAIERRTPLGRATAAVVATLGVLVFVAGLGAWAVGQLAAQATAAVVALPATIQTLRERLPDVEARAGALGLSLNVRALQEQLQDSLRSAGLASGVASGGLSLGAAWLAALGEGLLNVALVLVLFFYFLLEGDRLVTTLLTLAPARAKPYLLFAEKSLAQVVGGYARGQLTVAAIIGGTVFLVCLSLGVPYSLVLGVLAFFFEWVPYVGPTLTGVVMTAMALTESVWLAGAVLAFYVALQALESHVLAPRITGRAVGLHPVAALLGFVVGAKLFGLWGLLFAVPLLGFVYVVGAALYRQLRAVPVPLPGAPERSVYR